MRMLAFEREVIEMPPENGYRCFGAGRKILVLFGFLRIPLP